MEKAIHRLASRIPLTFKMLLVIAIVGLIVWAVMDRFVSTAVKVMFESHLTDTVEQQSQEDRLRFDRHIQTFHEVADIIVFQKKFFDYIETQKWFISDDPTIRYYDQYPEWFISSSIMRVLAIPRYALLLDSRKNVREIFAKNLDDLPKALLRPDEATLMKSEEETFIVSISNFPFLITSETMANSNGAEITLTLVSPIDDKFLMLSQGDFPKRLVGLVSPDNRAIIVSNNYRPRRQLEKKIGIGLENIKARYKLNDYGDVIIENSTDYFIVKLPVITKNANASIDF